MITYLPHDQIDQLAWDRRLEASGQAWWYAGSTVLNAAAPGWDALVDEASGACMPLMWRRKFGIHYLFQPFLLQHAGPYGPGPDPERAARFLEAVPRHFRYADIMLGAEDVQPPPPWRVEQRHDHVLPLHAGVEDLRAAYSDNHRRSVRKFSRSGLHVEAGVGSTEVIAALEGSEQFRRWRIDAVGRASLHTVLQATERDGTGFGRMVRTADGCLAVGWFVRHLRRIYFLKGVGTAAGRELRTMHALIDHVVEEFAGTGMVLDFAGGHDPQLARFYAGFGACKEVYSRALMNRLPPVVRRLKP
ncbi:MAG: hypothetical protein KBH07_00430 [Flavobacteriales bacterium]|nr:hypothetical protein [Flavobacteriales bacterium]MBP9079494.1 hypothetical protein [Flavobacteriales bacterium]